MKRKNINIPQTVNKHCLKILFVCIHNSARSQMAEAFTNYYGNSKIKAESAGIEKGILNPLVIKSMQEKGIDISSHKTKSIAEIIAAGKSFDYVITVCDQANSQRCPVVPKAGKRLHWDLPDPSSFEGSEAQILEQIAIIRDEIEKSVKDLLKELNIVINK